MTGLSIRAVVVPEVRPGVAERLVRLRVDRVLSLRPVQGYEGDPVPFLIFDHVYRRGSIAREITTRWISLVPS